MRATGRWLCLALCASGCILGGQTGQEDRPESSNCDAIEPSAVGFDEDTGAGLRAQDVADALREPQTGSLHWSRTGETSELQLQLIELQSAERIERTGPPGCDDTLRLSVRLRLSTADGQFDERVEGVLETAALNGSDPDALPWMVSTELALRDVAGSFDPAEHDVPAGGSGSDRLLLSLWIDQDGMSGSVGLDRERVQGGGTPTLISIAELPAP